MRENNKEWKEDMTSDCANEHIALTAFLRNDEIRPECANKVFQ